MPLPLPVSHSRSNSGEVKSGLHAAELEDAADGRVALAAQLLARDDQDPLARRTPRGRARAGTRRGRAGCSGAWIGDARRRARGLVAAADVVEIVREQAVDGVAHHVDQARVDPERLAHALGDSLKARPVRVVGRGLTADGGVRREVAAVPVRAQAPVHVLDEEVELLRARHPDLGMEVQVVVEARGPALEAADHDQVRQRALGAAPPGAPRLLALGGKALVGAGDHRLVGGILASDPSWSAHKRALSRSWSSPWRRVEPRRRGRSLPPRSASARPSSFSPWRLTQITGTFILSSRRDVGLVAGRDVDPALLRAEAARALLEVSLVRLVGADLLGGDDDVELGAKVAARDAEKLVVDVGDDADVVAVAERGPSPRSPRGRAASEGLSRARTGRARARAPSRSRPRP